MRRRQPSTTGPGQKVRMEAGKNRAKAMRAALTSRKRGSAAAGSQGTMPALARVQIPFLGARSQESVGFLVESIDGVHYGSHYLMCRGRAGFRGATPELGRDGRFRLESELLWLLSLLSAIYGDAWLGIKAARRICYIWMDCSSNVGIYIRQKKRR